MAKSGVENIHVTLLHTSCHNEAFLFYPIFFTVASKKVFHEGMIMVRPGVNPHVETLGTRVRFTTSPPYAYTSGVSQPNEISVAAVDDRSVEIH